MHLKKEGKQKMSLSRKLLESMGLDADKVSTIIENHAETVDGLKAEIAKYKADADKLPDVERKLSEAESKLSAAQDNEDWKAKYEKEHSDFESYKTTQDNKATRQAQEKAFVNALKEAGITSEYQLNLITKGAGEIISGITFDKDGNVKGIDALKQQITENYSGSVSTSVTQGVQTTTPPANNGGKMTKEEIFKIKDSAERQKAIAENLDLFN